MSEQNITRPNTLIQPEHIPSPIPEEPNTFQQNDQTPPQVPSLPDSVHTWSDIGSSRVSSSQQSAIIMVSYSSQFELSIIFIPTGRC